MVSPRPEFAIVKPGLLRTGLAFLLLTVAANIAPAQVALSTTTAHTQSFDGIGATATAALPSPYKVDKITTARTVGTYAAALTATERVDGASVSTTAAQGIYNFGAGSTDTGTDRAIGFISSGSGTNSGNIYVQLSNSTGAALTGLKISYNVEKYRNGSNANGFRIQMYYSTDGSTWTSAGSDFLTSFTANADNTGFATGPGSTTAVTEKTLTAAIANGSSLYLAWNYSVSAGTTVTNSQGLAVDDISILGVGESGGGSTNPTISGSASPSTVTAGGSTTLSGTLVAGSNPASATYAVACDLTSIGGSASQAANVSGTSWSYAATVTAGTGAGSKSITCTVTDDQSRTGTTTPAISLTVSAPTGVCGDAKTQISTIQGTGKTATNAGSTVTIEGIVIGAYQGSTGLYGFYIQDAGDSNPATSDGIFIDEDPAVSTSVAGTVTVGQQLRLTGTVAERFKQTTMKNITSAIVCTANITITPTDVTLPASVAIDDLANATDGGALEQYEGMLVRFPQQLRVTDNFDLGRFGEVSLAYVPPNMYGDGVTYTRLMAGAQVAAPGTPANNVTALNLRSIVLLDDGSNTTYGSLAPSAHWPLDGGGLTFTNTLRLGDRVNVNAEGTYTPVVGVLGYGFNIYRIQPVPGNAITFGPSDDPRPTTPPAVGGRVKVMSANVLNYFTTLTSQNSDARGANDAAEFERQRNKIIGAFRTADPAVIAISEMENLNATTAIDNLVNGAGTLYSNGLNTGNPGKWAYIDTGIVGTDAIRVGFIYQPAVVTPVGSYKVLDSSVDSRALTTRNRPAIAQTFRRVGTKSELQHFTVIANHFKSKGSACTSSPSDPDLSDGQDNCNLSRVSMSRALIDWLATNPTSDPTPAADRRFLIVGDLNAHLKEDAISALTNPAFTKGTSAVFPSGLAPSANAVFKDLVSTLGDKAGYSYLFSAESGALDHALANPALFRLITGVSEWHINADEPVVLDYNSDYDGNSSSSPKSGAQLSAWFDPGAFRTSDHDPLLVGFNPLAGDLDDDGDVDTADQTIMRNAVGKPLATVDRRTDYDGDGRITLTDFQRWSQYAAAYQR